MTRTFNVTGSCNPKLHYMVDITGRLEKIKALIDNGDYFTINRARQYGKTTTLAALKRYLNDQYVVIPLDFQLIGDAKFKSEHVFTKAFANYLKRIVNDKKNPIYGLDNTIVDEIVESAKEDKDYAFDDMFPVLSEMCDTAEKPVVLIIDEVDSATNNEVFLDFLAQLRGYYLRRTDNNTPTFQSVILAGVYDVKNIKIKMRQESDHKVNSPWNIATDFLVDMSFNSFDIKGMLEQYEADHHTGMDMELMASEIYDYTSGYPFLVSKICKLLDERVSGSEKDLQLSDVWTKEGLHVAVNILTSEKNTLFDSLIKNLIDYPDLKDMISSILFEGKDYPYVATNHSIEMAAMFGVVRNDGNVVKVSNRIFETVLYNHLLSEEIINSKMYDSALVNKYRFTEGRRLNMTKVLEGFVKAFREISQGKDERFLEEEGRKYFMLYLKPIINGTGHSYVEARTRNLGRTDLVVDYLGEQFVIELKIWNGPKYHAAGEAQTIEYLEYYKLKKGYMVTFNFNKHKETGVKEVRYGDYTLIEVVV